MTDVAVILVGLNARKFVLDCLKSLQDAQWRQVSHEVIYIDNGSTDASAEAVREQYPGVRVVANNSNLGYCTAANQGSRASDARYFYFINDDTLVINDAIALLVEYMDANPQVGTVGSRLLYPDGQEQYSGRRFPTLWAGILGRQSLLTRLLPRARPVADYLCTRELEAGKPFDVDWVSAAGQIVRREIFEQVGGYAEDYYYWHEAVFCHRISQLGQQVMLHPDSKIIHYEGQGSGARPRNVQQFHIVNFHLGAFRAYREWYDLGIFNPLTWLVGTALGTRGLLLYATTWLPMRRA